VGGVKKGFITPEELQGAVDKSIPQELTDAAAKYKKPTYFVKQPGTGTVRYTIGDEKALQSHIDDTIKAIKSGNEHTIFNGYMKAKGMDLNDLDLRLKLGQDLKKGKITIEQMAKEADLPLPDINAIRKKVIDGIGVYGNKPPQAKVTKVTQPDFEPDLEENVLRKWGETSDPENASFITSDGRYVSWGGGDTRYADHREIAIGELQDYMNKTQNIRVHNSPGSSDVNVDIVYKPNDEQTSALRNMMEGKKIYSDVSGLDGSKKASGEFDTFSEWLSWVEKHAL
jgi:hypothetical protein